MALLEYRIVIETAKGRFYVKEFDCQNSKFTPSIEQSFTLTDWDAIEIMADEICQTFDTIEGASVDEVFIEGYGEDAGPA